MSWNASFQSKASFDANQPDFESPAGVSASDSAEADQYNAARAAAKAVIDSGAVGANGKDFAVSLSGHTNPRHEPRSGWANDCVSVSITQKS